MAILFPDIQPSSRRFVAPRWPTSSNSSQSGVISHRLWGSKPGNGQLSLGFSNIRDDLAAQIVDAYNSAKGATIDIILPPAVFKGATGALGIYLQSALGEQGLKWYFKDDDPPEIESVVPGISSARVNLSGELRME